ncbi:MAG: hypothetical protein A2487_10345 [Candidatus Raymondbacteria bacterium RifOxyC12_full_50_8]|uniref:RNA 2-O ribose methyltransferase substrate binding domain-containing protein n=1 Tax=Candidatus Raymondbacteria bacterium RIFOXYD12_FULL_49_13 TaxID=1817890 RepID=A0A1F7F020_UNCRA|nr:MAG: hypothetical protein A2350_00630 [Candidatus Raymondbacteria bacterium RifOxyB12_full_50_8]OGJ96543.1 MAG: hypothetical protein A2453_03250 [Candidatus Raymondbacteria bacterium RIFOXYC2_FULL_50_21]OGJ99168.1 MAG: hypothetical protein A2487_10345 [Candidatus Raymondbacteria bacterium RifOxyC12_full_50_8]OGJ99984.1 MAG: hypothetical protein A2519_13500 [Candidatus Raymondbacteria bacterium RIFOXYD12_FULL_49_13]OGP41930.1 MAG: hypothetical protein A2324_22815 [Candidatus Raymondbacteria b
MKLLKSLSQKKYRDEHGKFLAEGPDVVEQLVASGHMVHEIIIDECLRSKYASIAARAASQAISLCYVPERTISELAETITTQGILAVAQKNLAAHPTPGLSVYLDAVQNPGNVGAVIRTAAATGFANVIAGKGTADFFNPKTVRGSAGGICEVNLIDDRDQKWLPEMKKMGYVVATTSCTKGKLPVHFKAREKTVIIMGNEGGGVSGPVQKLADEYIHIPMRRNIKSLNIAVAFGVIAFTIASD